MAETTFLASVEAFLKGRTLVPSPALVGVAEPTLTAELPALVLSLEQSERPGSGLGERSAMVTGALPWQVSIDLANPVLPEDPTFVLLDALRTHLILPHGGLVRSDGSDPGALPLRAGDVTVTVDGTPRAVVTSAPVANQVRVSATTGELTFGTALPATGIVAVTYVLGQWEQRTERIAGVLRIDTCAASAGGARTLSDGVLSELLSPGARTDIVRLQAIAVAAVGSIAVPDPTAAVPLRRRTARLTFRFEAEINRPDSSGGVIHEIEATSQVGDGQRPPGPLPDSDETFTISA